MKFTDILDQYRIPYKTEGKHCRPGWVQLDCPFCQGPLYLGYNIAGNYCNCWRCGPHQTADVIHRASGGSVAKLGEISFLLKGLDRTTEVDLPIRGKLELPKGIGSILAIHAFYLEQRRFKIKRLEKLWEIKAIGLLGGVLKWRIFIPIYYHGKMVSWTTRSISDYASVRYISAKADQEIINHKDLLYGEDYVRHSVVVHEGPLDVWATGPGAVATFGTGVRPAQVEKLSRYPKRVICFDSEREAQKRARALADALEPFPGETFNVVLESKDPADATPKERKMLRKFLED